MISCPYCEQEIKDGETTCPRCQRDLTLAKPLIEKIADLEDRIATLSDQNSELKETVSATLEDSSPPPPEPDADEAARSERRRVRWKKQRAVAEKIAQRKTRLMFLVMSISIGLFILSFVISRFFPSLSRGPVTAFALSATLPGCIWLGHRTRERRAAIYLSMGLILGLFQITVLWIMRSLYLIHFESRGLSLILIPLITSLSAVLGGLFGSWMRTADGGNSGPPPRSPEA